MTERKLTGRRRYRNYRLPFAMPRDLVVLQVEEKWIEMTPGGSVYKRAWRDALMQDLTVMEHGEDVAA